MPQQSLPVKQQLMYAFGMMGWSILINLISVILVYLYVPPAASGFPLLISQAVFFGVFNLMAIITAGGRLVDALYDPFIAQLSDSSQHPKGRRTPFMKWAILPSVVFCCLVFYPLHTYQSTGNTVWLTAMLIGFYVSTTTFIIPYNALLPELAHDGPAKVKLATWQSVGYVMGIGISSNAFNVIDWLHTLLHLSSRLVALQYTVALFALLAAVCMAITAFGINEKKYATGLPSTVPLKLALQQTLRNRNFQLFIVADFAYFIAVTIITSGLLYFVSVLLQLPETMGNKLMITMVLVSFIFYPVTNYLSAKIGKKRIIVYSLLLLSVVFAGIYFLGKVDINRSLQIYLLIILAAIPVASLNILPNAVLAEIIEEDGLKTGNNKEAIYFAVRYFFVKIAQTLGIALFAMLLIYGKDIANDTGIRLNGAVGFILCVAAALIFNRFKEQPSA